MKNRHKNVVASYLILKKNHDVLLLRRFNTGYEDGNYSLIAGHLEAGETFTQCIVREAYEEAGIVLQPYNLQVAHVMHRNSGLKEENERVDVFFIANEWSGEIVNKEPHKCDDLSWFAQESLPENIVPYIKQVIDHINNNNLYSEFGW